MLPSSSSLLPPEMGEFVQKPPPEEKERMREREAFFAIQEGNASLLPRPSDSSKRENEEKNIIFPTDLPSLWSMFKWRGRSIRNSVRGGGDPFHSRSSRGAISKKRISALERRSFLDAALGAEEGKEEDLCAPEVQ